MARVTAGIRKAKARWLKSWVLIRVLLVRSNFSF